MNFETVAKLVVEVDALRTLREDTELDTKIAERSNDQEAIAEAVKAEMAARSSWFAKRTEAETAFDALCAEHGITRFAFRLAAL